MSTATPAFDAPEKEIERTYLVELTPLDGPVDGRLPYDPMRVRLRYTVDEAGTLDGRSERALQEAVKRAERLERKHHDTAPDTVFAGSARLVREALVDYLPRERPRPTRSSR